jgi:BASS family bile acid:Na+ symporter
MVDFLAEVVVPIAMFVMMFGMGLTLSVDDFKKIMVFPRAVLLGLVIQLLLMPAIGLALASMIYMAGMVPATVAVMIAFNFFKKNIEKEELQGS